MWWTGNDRESLRGTVNLADQSAAADEKMWAAIGDWPGLDDGFRDPFALRVLDVDVGPFAATPAIAGDHEIDSFIVARL